MPTRTTIERRSELDVAADALAAVFASGLVPLSAGGVRVLAHHVGVEPERVLLAVRRHAEGNERRPRDVAVSGRVAPVVSLADVRRPAPITNLRRVGRPGHIGKVVR